jgi:hypothetical protein
LLGRAGGAVAQPASARHSNATIRFMARTVAHTPATCECRPSQG